MIPTIISDVMDELTKSLTGERGNHIHLDRHERMAMTAALIDILDKLSITHWFSQRAGAAERRRAAAAYSWHRSSETITNVHARFFTSYLAFFLKDQQPPTRDMKLLATYAVNLIVLLAQRGAIEVPVDVASPSIKTGKRRHPSTVAPKKAPLRVVS